MKTCTGCKETKDFSLFSKREQSPDGLQPKCKVCCSIIDKTRYNLNPQEYIKRAAEWANKNPIRALELHREAERRRRKKYPELHREAVKRCYRKYPEKRRIHDAARKRQVRKATPKWAKRGEVAKQLRHIYALCPNNMSVDHIVPLRGKNVSGLHVPWNLQFMDLIENIRKSNKF